MNLTLVDVILALLPILFCILAAKFLKIGSVDGSMVLFIIGGFVTTINGVIDAKLAIPGMLIGTITIIAVIHNWYQLRK